MVYQAFLVALVVLLTAPFHAEGLAAVQSPSGFSDTPSDVVEKCFGPGATITVQVGVIANHTGIDQVQACHLEDAVPDDITVPDDCFQPVEEPHDSAQWLVVPGTDVWSTNVTLPSENASRIVLRWMYIGRDPIYIPQMALQWGFADLVSSDSCGAVESQGHPNMRQHWIDASDP